MDDIPLKLLHDLKAEGRIVIDAANPRGVLLFSYAALKENPKLAETLEKNGMVFVAVPAPKATAMR